MKRFENKTVIITGGASGIGESSATLFAQEGANVVIADININAGQKLADKLGGIFVKTDVGCSSEVDALFETALKKYGSVDILLNNAFRSEAGPIEKLSDESWRKALDVTLDAVFYGSRAAVRVMKPGSSIINVASISGLGADYGIATYNTAKAAVINFTRALAIECGKKGIRVNAICPGVINTPPLQLLWEFEPALRQAVVERVPLGRLGEAGDVARTILFLCSADAAYIHGASIVIDGGLTCSSGIPKLMPDM